MSEQITEERLRGLVERFYTKVRQDELIGPLFNRSIDDWPAHLGKLTAFWSSLMLRSGTYNGRPVPAHLKHVDDITPTMFDRWLMLWTATTAEVMPAPAAEELQAKAALIAESLKLALAYHKGEPTLASPGATQRPN